MKVIGKGKAPVIGDRSRGCDWVVGNEPLATAGSGPWVLGLGGEMGVGVAAMTGGIESLGASLPTLRFDRTGTVTVTD